MKDEKTKIYCDVCGALATLIKQKQVCHFCKFEKDVFQEADVKNENLISAIDINQFLKEKYATLKHGDTFEISVPVTRFYKKPTPQPGQVNYFRSKNIMFLLEQHGFQMVNRKSRFSSVLCLTVRKV